MNLILLSEAVEEVVEETTSTGISLTDSQIKLILLVVAVIGIALYFILRPTPEKTEQAKKFLNSLATQIMGIVYANLEYKIETYNGTIDLSFEEFRDKIVEVVYVESWSFVEKAVKDAVEAGKSEITVLNKTNGKEIPVLCELSGRTKDIMLAGGLLDFTRESMK